MATPVVRWSDPDTEASKPYQFFLRIWSVINNTTSHFPRDADLELLRWVMAIGCEVAVNPLVKNLGSSLTPDQWQREIDCARTNGLYPFMISSLERAVHAVQSD